MDICLYISVACSGRAVGVGGGVAGSGGGRTLSTEAGGGLVYTNMDIDI